RQASVPGPQDHLVEVDEGADLGLHACLLENLTPRGGAGGLTGLDMSAGQAPSPLERALRPLDQQHGVIAEDRGARAAPRPRLPPLRLSCVLAHASATLGANRPPIKTLHVPPPGLCRFGIG